MEQAIIFDELNPNSTSKKQKQKQTMSTHTLQSTAYTAT